MDAINEYLLAINERLEKIDTKLACAENWSDKLQGIESRINNLENAIKMLEEIKERVVKIELLISNKYAISL